MKKLLTLVLSAMLAVGACFGLTACGGAADYNELIMPAYGTAFADVSIDKTFKLGVICLHDENSTYDKNFLEAVETARIAFNLSKSQVIIKTGVGEDESCTTAARELVTQGCKAIFADSFGHEAYLKTVAEENPSIQFFHATGTQAKIANLDNFHNAFASIYEGRYLAGVAAGLKLKEMVENGKITSANKDNDGNIKLGYVGAHNYAEVISGYTSWFLGVRSIVPNVVMQVQYTFSWYDEALEKSAAEMLINNGCALISQHADSWGAPNACERAGVYNVSYNGSTISKCPETFIISSKIDWSYYFQWIIASVGGDAEEVPANYTGTIGESKMVVLSNANADVCVDGTIPKLVAIRDDIVSGKIRVFDCSKFTVGGVNLTEYQADVIDDGTFTKDTNVIKTDASTGITYFDESNSDQFRSAPYFDIIIDGITELNAPSYN